MSGVKRYAVLDHSFVERREAGAFVTHADYVALAARLAECEREVQFLRSVRPLARAVDDERTAREAAEATIAAAALREYEAHELAGKYLAAIERVRGCQRWDMRVHTDAGVTGVLPFDDGSQTGDYILAADILRAVGEGEK